eukprot:Amastigsp_a5222_11.p2 type:complete len:117 gc:universal Amastigsp_a5222_11:772-422(-)
MRPVCTTCEIWSSSGSSAAMTDPVWRRCSSAVGSTTSTSPTALTAQQPTTSYISMPASRSASDAHDAAAAIAAVSEPSSTVTWTSTTDLGNLSRRTATASASWTISDASFSSSCGV